MNKKIAFLGAVALTGSALLAAPTTYSIAYHTFEGKGSGLNPWPADAKPYVTMVADVAKKSKTLKVVVPADKKSTTFYQSVVLKAPGPGKIVMTIEYKFAKAVEGSAFNLQMNYNYPKGGNGSAGNTKVKFEAAPEWKTFKQEFQVPANAVAIQYVFSLSGAGSELLVDNVKMTYTPAAAPAAK